MQEEGFRHHSWPARREFEDQQVRQRFHKDEGRRISWKDRSRSRLDRGHFPVFQSLRSRQEKTPPDRDLLPLQKQVRDYAQENVSIPRSLQEEQKMQRRRTVALFPWPDEEWGWDIQVSLKLWILLIIWVIKF